MAEAVAAAAEACAHESAMRQQLDLLREQHEAAAAARVPSPPPEAPVPRYLQPTENWLVHRAEG